MLRSFVSALLLAAVVRAQSERCPGQYEMSVEGVEGIFCVADQRICIAQVYDGACPEIQEGLSYGSYCGVVATGVYGCKVLDANSIQTLTPAPEPTTETPVPEPDTPEPSSETPEPETPEPETPEPETPEPSSETPEPWSETPEPLSETPEPASQTPTPQPTTAAPSSIAPAPTTGPSSCDNNWSPMSVQGVAGVFCAPEPVCVADRENGGCPVAQDGLEYGATCGVVRTGVFGCIPNNSSGLPVDIAYPLPTSCAGNEAGDTPVSVEGVGTFCAMYPVCAGEIFGECPGVQEGLDRASVCATVRTGVYGCVLPAISQ
ncbi:hypothetical protein Poli38472_008434 [Pythium oligandrum]|uniref:Uncharacterized protein n=1 Tax=Pythium oligandrum TaxID=41045 RepID=A0A8K1CNR2_PYTOL|nr:hypothetical protein Poli38472_008429 [Pythium oligandrum]TMW65788.1 hypothetical protein Poli38472_008430 [Pythium oligandrum]TMW65789.1 hypothetical protein Poli38472_008431 [Pythium oligandrum]TMW65791.1 hypothetical protein Poli38472_008433 [Pythium oligandrum]TMW65792.1 hypothetical protein Poli38472_008434 [Pythium oligandrum]|eukprot:TMW65787.1 hypothetical protein Poli38472_008429 [Pythium oligandrum]